ncbi:amidohydrolase family protein [[Muricauda] lutisoli]|uniref:Amidohydrolase family protein n=1 Tax=[Muricauda] lutisoli TaxID=2816035 RepID=A0ABS3ETA1_9FLAO|nr:amidohydrolase family protein [[Muricauda] lutisoli]MBO0329475.1 amidohydrolase family protein [[Muricauda] lutisoli]
MTRPLLLFLLLIIVSCKKKAVQQYDLAITNAQVIHLETGKIEKQNIFISNGRIESVASVDSNDFKAGATVDASGKFVLPGFWDNHIHLRGGDTLINNNKNFLKLFIANGITTVRDAGGDLTHAVMDWKNQIASEELVGPTIFTAGPKIDGPNGSWAGSLEVETEADVIHALDSLESLNVDFVKIYDSRISRDNYLRSIEEAKKRGFTVSGHMPFTVTLDETINAGMDGIEHLYYIMKGCASNEIEITDKLNQGEIGFWGAMPALMEGYSDTTAQTTFNSLKENDVFVVPTLHIGHTLSYLDEVDHSNDEYLQYMGSGIIQTYQGRIRSALNASEEARENRKQLDTFFGKLAKSIDSAGVQLLAGSDSGAFNSYTYPGISLHKELQAMVDNGISPLDALRTSSVNGAKFLDQTEDYGKISKGKISDLVILDANPLENIENTEKIYGVIKGSQVFSKSELQELLNNSVMD